MPKPVPDAPANGTASPERERLFDVQTMVSDAPRRPAPIEFTHCGAVHYVTNRPVSRTDPLPPEAVSMVCGRCPVPHLGLAMRCHQCQKPLDIYQDGQRLRPVSA